MFDIKYEKMIDFIFMNYDWFFFLNFMFMVINNGKIGIVVFKVFLNIYNVSGGGLKGVFIIV